MPETPRLLRFVRTPEYEKQLATLAKTATDRDAIERVFERTLCENPGAGDRIQGTGGVQKLRIALPGRGKSGGARLIYYHVDRAGVIYLLTIYAKNVADSISDAGKQALKKYANELEKHT